MRHTRIYCIRVCAYMYVLLYNNPNYLGILIGSCLWSIRGQTHKWRRHYKVFPLCFQMAESFENIDNMTCDWAKDKVQKSLVEALNRYKKQEEKRKSSLFSGKWLRKNTPVVSVSSRVRLNQTQNWSWNYMRWETIALSQS